MECTAADSQDKLTHEEVQSLAETWGMIAAGGFIREMQETRILVPDGELMVFLGNEGLDYFVCPEEVLKGTAHTLNQPWMLPFIQKHISQSGVIKGRS